MSVLCLDQSETWILEFMTYASLHCQSTPDARWFLEITEGFAGRVTCYLSTYYILQLCRWSGPWTPAPCWVTISFSILYLLIFFVKRDQTKSLALTNVLCTLKWKLCCKSFAWEVCLLFIDPFNCSPDLPVEGSGACFIMVVFYNFYGYRCWF